MRAVEHRQAYRYNRWANGRIFEVVLALGDDVVAREMGSSFTSILETARHLVSGEWIWLRRWKGESPAGMPDRFRSAGIEGIREWWGEVAEEQNAFVAGLKETDLDVEIGYRNIKGDELAFPLWHMLRHVVNHSSYHRGQITTMIRQLGATAVGTDMIGHLDD